MVLNRGVPIMSFRKPSRLCKKIIKAINNSELMKRQSGSGRTPCRDVAEAIAIDRLFNGMKKQPSNKEFTRAIACLTDSNFHHAANYVDSVVDGGWDIVSHIVKTLEGRPARRRRMMVDYRE